jgi:hypothetical protein
VDLTQIQLIAQHAEKSALEASDSAKSATAGAPLPADQAAKLIAEHQIRFADHDAIANKLRASTLAKVPPSKLPGMHAAYSAHAAAASAHVAAASAHNANQDKHGQEAGNISAIVAHLMSANQHKTEAQKHTDSSVLLQDALNKTSPPQKPILMSAVNANRHAADANKSAEAIHNESGQKLTGQAVQTPFSAPTTQRIRQAAFQIFTERKTQSLEQFEQLRDWFEGKSNVMVQLLLQLEKIYGFKLDDPDNQLH